MQDKINWPEIGADPAQIIDWVWVAEKLLHPKRVEEFFRRVLPYEETLKIEIDLQDNSPAQVMAAVYQFNVMVGNAVGNLYVMERMLGLETIEPPDDEERDIDIGIVPFVKIVWRALKEFFKGS